MNRYAPLWSGIVDSSVWCLDKSVRVLWVTMLALQDRDHVVRYSAFALGQRGHLSEAEVLEGLRVLSEPDRERLEKQEFEGRRIAKVEGGWLILNGEKYQRMMVGANRREYMRRYMAELRGKVGLAGKTYKTAEERVEEKGESAVEAIADGVGGKGYSLGEKLRGEGL